MYMYTRWRARNAITAHGARAPSLMLMHKRLAGTYIVRCIHQRQGMRFGKSAHKAKSYDLDVIDSTKRTTGTSMTSTWGYLISIHAFASVGVAVHQWRVGKFGSASFFCCCHCRYYWRTRQKLLAECAARLHLAMFILATPCSSEFCIHKHFPPFDKIVIRKSRVRTYARLAMMCWSRGTEICGGWWWDFHFFCSVVWTAKQLFLANHCQATDAHPMSVQNGREGPKSVGFFSRLFLMREHQIDGSQFTFSSIYSIRWKVVASLLFLCMQSDETRKARVWGSVWDKALEMSVPKRTKSDEIGN